MELRSRLGVSHPKLLAVVGLMEQGLEEPFSQTELALKANLSTRQLERLFKKYLSTTPTRYYLNLRLAKPPSAATDFHVDTFHCPSLRVCVCVAFF